MPAFPNPLQTIPSAAAFSQSGIFDLYCPVLVGVLPDGRGVIINPLTGNSSYARKDEIDTIVRNGQGIQISLLAPMGHTVIVPITSSNDKAVDLERRVAAWTYANVAERRSICPLDLTPSWYTVETRNSISLWKTRQLADQSLETTSCCFSEILQARWKSHISDSETVLLPKRNLKQVEVKLTKHMLQSIQLIGAYDDSVLVCAAEYSQTEDSGILLLVDQHALHERIRLERLLKDSFESAGYLRTCNVVPHLRLNLSIGVITGIARYDSKFKRLGLHAEIRKAAEEFILVSKVPYVLVTKNGTGGDRESLRADLRALVEEALHIFAMTSRDIFILPPIISTWLATTACRGAVMFGDAIPFARANALLGASAGCDLPFQCAHGRPSMVPIALPKAMHEKRRHLSWKPLIESSIEDSGQESYFVHPP